MQTERALFEALASLSNNSLSETTTESIDSAFSIKRAKAARMDEWTRLPLITTQDREAWYSEKASKVGISQQSPIHGQEDALMTETTSPYGTHSFQARSEDLPTPSWSLPHAHSASLSTVRENLPDHFSQIPLQTPNSNLPATQDWQMQSSIRPSSADNREHSTPQGVQNTTKAEILSTRNSRRFF